MTTILIVDDDPQHRRLMQRRLTGRGYRALVATGGADALACAGCERPDVILMDLRMARGDGWSTTAALKADEGTRTIAVIAVSALDLPRERARALAAGCDDFEPKPVVFSRLLEKIERLNSTTPG